MIFTNPWGLLALLSIPAILGLHFFRARRSTRRVGGLHLWRFAETRLPVGGRFNRLIRSLPLLFQLLAALLLSLLLAGFDLPREDERTHFTLVLDNSVSMQARPEKGRESAADRARQILAKIGGAGDKFTLIAAGIRPEIIAGPFASKKEMLARAAAWTPEAPVRDLESALNLASRFLTGGQKLLFITDADTTATPLVETAAVGAPLPNAAIDFADRARIAPDRDRVDVSLRAYASAPLKVRLQALADSGTVLEKECELPPDKPVHVSFETTALDKTLTLRIGPDALEADNIARLAPVPVKIAHVYLMGLGAVEPHFLRAIKAIPGAEITDYLSKAELVISAVTPPAPAPANVLLCLLPSAAEIAAADKDSSGGITLAQSGEIVADCANPIVFNLPMEGVLWPYLKRARPPRATDPLTAPGASLLWFEKPVDAPPRCRLNLAWDRTNIHRTPALPLLLQGIVEECRRNMPGMHRFNYNAGEAVRPRLPAGTPGPLELRRDGKLYATYGGPPEILSQLPAGLYELSPPDGRPIARFCVNLSSAGESDLRACSSRAPSLGALTPATLRKAESNQAVYYALLGILLLLTALSWIYQDTTR